MANQGIRIQTLGRLLIEQEKEAVEGFVTLKASLLFCYLALNPGKHKRESLAPLLWSDTPDTQALKNLRTVLSSLRKTVPDFIDIDSETIEAKGQIWIDSQTFEALCDSFFAGASLSFNELLAGAALYKGDFLQDVYARQAEGLESWIDYKRENLQQKYQQFLYKLIELCIQKEEFYQGLEFARQLIRMNPLWEAAQRQLMLLLVYLNQSGEALIQYERLVTLLQNELDTEPEEETIALHRKIKGRMIQATTKKNTPKIILPDLPYISPQKDLNALRDLLNKGDSRLISLIGFSGMGKSSLALYLAHERQRDYRDGALIVPLSSVSHAQNLANTILSYLNIPILKASQELLIDELKEREMLLVLDNYEQLLPDTRLIQMILEEAPGVQLLITSQIPLNLREERQFVLSGLSLERAFESEAVQLFRQTAERILPNFEINQHRETILAICQELDGLPLGILIAASQIKYLAPADILKVLRENILTLSLNYQDMPKRHQSFGSLLHNTFLNLSAEEYQALLALTIFRGSFDHRAALAVAGIEMQGFVRLVDKALIQSVGNFRYSLHAMLRRALNPDFEQSPQREKVRQRFTAYYQQWIDELYNKRISSDVSFPLVDTEQANIWHIDLLSEEEKQHYLLHTLPALQQYWSNRDFIEEVLAIVSRGVENERLPQPLRARGMVEIAMIILPRGQQDRVQSLTERAMQLEPDNLYIHVQGLQIFARLAMQRGQHAKAREYLENVLELESHENRSDDAQIDFLFIGNHVGLGLILMDLGENDLSRLHFNMALQAWLQLNLPPRLDVLNNLAMLDSRDKNFEAAQAKYLQVIEAGKAVNNFGAIMSASSNLGELLVKTGDYAEAYRRVQDAIRLGMRHKRITSVLLYIETMTRLAYFLKQYTVAVQLRGFVLKSYQEYKLGFADISESEAAAQSAEMQQMLGKRFEQLLNMGKKFSLDAAIALCDSLATALGEGDEVQK